MFNLDTIELFNDDCRLLVTFENSLDQDQVTVLCVYMCVCLSVCLSVLVRAFACLHIGAELSEPSVSLKCQILMAHMRYDS